MPPRVARLSVVLAIVAGWGGGASVAGPDSVRVTVVVREERPDDVAGLPRGRLVRAGDPPALLGIPLATEVGANGATLLDADGDGKAETKVASGRLVRVTVRRGDGSAATLAVVLDAEGGEWRMRVASVLRVTGGGREVLLLDLDADGSATGPRDGVLAAGGRLVVPLRLPLVAAGLRWDLKGCDLGSPAATPTFEPPPKDPLVAATLDRINAFRRTTGLPEVALDEKLTDGCRKHHAYMTKHGWDPHDNPHDEDPSKPGFTPEGRDAAKNANLMRFDGPAAMEAWIRTHYHLAPFLVPGLARVGIATGGGWSVVDNHRGVDPAPFWKAPYVRSPAPGEEGVHPGFWEGEEIPCPVPFCGKRGHAINVLALPSSGGGTRPVGVSLRRKGGNEVALLPAIVDPIGTYPLLGGGCSDAPLPAATYEAWFVPAPGQPEVRWTFTVDATPPPRRR